MPSDNYPYAIGAIRIIENSLLDDSRLQRLKTLSYEDALRQLNEWGYAADYPVKEDPDALIDFRTREIHAIIDEVTPQKELTDLFWLSLDAVNLKYLIKARMLGTANAGESELEKGVYDIALLRECVESKDYTALDSPLGDLLTEADTRLGQDTSPKEVSAAVDKAVFAHIFAQLKKHPNPLCLRYFTAKADYTNILSMLRANVLGWSDAELAMMLVPGGAIPEQVFVAHRAAEPDKLLERLITPDNADTLKQAFAVWETDGAVAMARVLDEDLLDKVRDERFDSFGIGPIAYFMLRGIEESRSLRVLFARKRANL